MDFVMTRGPDLLRVGVRLLRFSVSAGVAHAEQDARIVLVLPPQHLAEETRGDLAPADWVAQGIWSATTQLVFAIPAGADVALTADGVLAACTTLAEPGATAAEETVVELPWRLRWTPRADGPVRSDHRLPRWLTTRSPDCGCRACSAPGRRCG